MIGFLGLLGFAGGFLLFWPNLFRAFWVCREIFVFLTHSLPVQLGQQKILFFFDPNFHRSFGSSEVFPLL